MIIAPTEDRLCRMLTLDCSSFSLFLATGVVVSDAAAALGDVEGSKSKSFEFMIDTVF